jgi:DNA-binding ferritin-like protein (Dps family)
MELCFIKIKRIKGGKIMNFLEKITGSDMTKEFKTYEARVKRLPTDYQKAWEEIKSNIWIYSNFSGRNLMSILEGVVGLLEISSADEQQIEEVFGGDIKGFCSSLASEEGAKSYRDKWRDNLNKNIAKKLGGLK